MIFATCQSPLTTRVWGLQDGADLHGNTILDNYDALSAGRVLAVATRGPDCWDCALYLKHSPDLKYLNMSCFDAFNHFVNQGQFELRTHRCCPAITPVPLTDRDILDFWV